MIKKNNFNDLDESINKENIKDSLYNLYLLIKREIPDRNEINISKAKIKDLISVLKSSIQILLIIINNNTHNQLQLENHIIKLESDIRYYIQREFQSKIRKDALEMKLRAYMGLEEEYESLKEKVRYEGGKFLNNDRKDNEILILRQENSLLKNDIGKLEQKNKELNEIINKNQVIIKALKYKVNQLEKSINELKTMKSNNVHNIHNNSSINLNIINNNNGIKNNVSNMNNMNNINNLNNNNNNKKLYNITITKKYFETLNKNYKNNLHIRRKSNIYHSPKITYQFETINNNRNKKNKVEPNKKNKIFNTIDSNKLFINTYNKIYNSHTSNNKNRNKKLKGSSISMRLDDNDKSDLINKYLSINNSSKYLSSIKTKSFSKISKSIPKYKAPLSNKNESIANNFGSIRHYLTKKNIKREKRVNDHTSLIIKRITKNKK